ncbi:MAG: alpha/beta hydrolase [Bacteroidota bacterium]
MKLIIRVTLFFLIGTSLACYGQRYRDQIFNEVSKETVTYHKEKDLQMDIYQPTEDSHQKRPVLLFVHGGGFAGGARDEPEIMDFCKNMARRGVVAVSMSYTLVMKGKSFSCDRPAKEKMWTFKHVAQEIVDATNYLLAQKQSLSIDPNTIVLAGSSAGAEAVMHAAYWPEAQKSLPEDFNYAGVISMAGAIYDVDLITKESAIPTQLFHGTCDELVPYGTASHHYCDENEVGYLVLHGPETIMKRLQSLNKGYYAVTGCNDRHLWAGKPFKKYRSEIADFLLYDVIQGKTRQIHEINSPTGTCQLVDAPSICND